MSSTINCADCGATLQETRDDEASTKSPCVACGSTNRHYSIIPETGHINLSPFAFQWCSKDFYQAYKSYVDTHGSTPFSPARLTLLAQAIELAAKSLHVHQGKRDCDLRKVGHDLVKACDSTVLILYGISLTNDEQTELRKMSELNEAKAFEYFWFRANGVAPERNGILHAINGRQDLPDEKILERLLNKLLAPEL